MQAVAEEWIGKIGLRQGRNRIHSGQGHESKIGARRYPAARVSIEVLPFRLRGVTLNRLEGMGSRVG